MSGALIRFIQPVAALSIKRAFIIFIEAFFAMTFLW